MDENVEDYQDMFFEVGVVPDGEAWFSNLLFWRPSKLSDEKMQLHFSDWDGTWTVQTKEALTRLKAVGIDLNDNWALTPPSWNCPACKRNKSEIFRLSKRGVLLAKLELHHDHLRNTIWKRAEERFGKDWLKTHTASGPGNVLDCIQKITSRFDFCLICSECNAADGNVKRQYRAEIDARFTFVASEIAEFVTPSANSDHKIDFGHAYKIWQQEKNGFESRVALIDTLTDHLRSGHLKIYSDGNFAKRVMSAFGSESLLMESFRREARNTQRAILLEGFYKEFLARSTKRDSAKLPVLTKLRSSSHGPSEQEYRAYVDPVSARRWQSFTETWRCPICSRQKPQIVRLSKTRQWTGGIRDHRELIRELNVEAISNRSQLFPKFNNYIFVSNIEVINICSDCSAIASRLAQWDRALGSPYLSIQDLRDSLASVQPNGRHDIDFETAKTRAIANEIYHDAVSAYSAFRSVTAEFSTLFRLLSKSGMPRKEIVETLSHQIEVFHDVEDKSECLRLTEWLLQEGITYQENGSC